MSLPHDQKLTNQKYHSALYSPHNDRFIVTTTHHPAPNNTIITKEKYESSSIGSKTYSNNLNRSFNHLKNIVFFNPDMIYFITFTYHDIVTDVNKVQNDIKALVKYTKRSRQRLAGTGSTPKIGDLGNAQKLGIENTRFLGEIDTPPWNGNTDTKIAKYAYVLEYQKRGSLHVHMIANDFFITRINEHGHPEVKYWSHGFTNVQRVTDFDKNFKPYLYMFKYMQKSERIGKRFIYTSRGLANFVKIDYDSIRKISEGKTPIHTHRSSFTLPNNQVLETKKEYYTYE